MESLDVHMGATAAALAGVVRGSPPWYPSQCDNNRHYLHQCQHWRNQHTLHRSVHNSQAPCAKWKEMPRSQPTGQSGHQSRWKCTSTVPLLPDISRMGQLNWNPYWTLTDQCLPICTQWYQDTTTQSTGHLDQMEAP